MGARIPFNTLHAPDTRWRSAKAVEIPASCTVLRFLDNRVRDFAAIPSSLSEPLSLAVQALLAPLEKRFVYHFYGEKKTNAKDKVGLQGVVQCGQMVCPHFPLTTPTLSLLNMPPLQPEWFLSQVLSWIRKHTPFINDRVQPFLQDTPYAAVNMKVGS